MKLSEAVRIIGTTKGGPVWAKTLHLNGFGPVSLTERGFLVGWSKWSDLSEPFDILWDPVVEDYVDEHGYA